MLRLQTSLNHHWGCDCALNSVGSACHKWGKSQGELDNHKAFKAFPSCYYSQIPSSDRLRWPSLALARLSLARAGARQHQPQYRVSCMYLRGQAQAGRQAGRRAVSQAGRAAVDSRQKTNSCHVHFISGRTRRTLERTNERTRTMDETPFPTQSILPLPSSLDQ